jgi:hypothetical protein
MKGTEEEHKFKRIDVSRRGLVKYKGRRKIDYYSHTFADESLCILA